MVTEDAFIKAIVDNPDDDDLRLIYADWLEERGDSRSEFIRIQVDLQRQHSDTMYRGSYTESSLDEWVARCDLSILLGPLADWIPARDDFFIPSSPKMDYDQLTIIRKGIHVIFKRGFIVSVRMGANDFLEIAETLFAAAPLLRGLEILNLQKRGMELAASPHLGRFSLLRFWGGARLSTDVVQVLAASPYVNKLQHLMLPLAGGGDVAVRFLAASAQLAGLEKLDLSENQIGDAGVTALANSQSLGRLKDLNLSNNAIGPTGLEALIGAPLLHPSALGLRGNPCCPDLVEVVEDNDWMAPRGLFYSKPDERLMRTIENRFPWHIRIY